MFNDDENLPRITRKLVPEGDRVTVSARIFGDHFPLLIEPYVYTVARDIADEYTGGYWDFYLLSNSGFYMSPSPDKRYSVSCPMNFFNGELSADALGIVACLTAYSHLSFCSEQVFARECARQFHLLRTYACEHEEGTAILSAID